jgi:cysteine desulfurase
MYRLRRQVYLDNNATTQVAVDVRKTISRILKHSYGNPSSLYRVARDSGAVLAESRQQVAQTINAKPEEIYFTGSASEANNQVLKALARSFYPQKDTIISTPIEHPSVLKTLEFLSATGIKVLYCPVDSQGRVILTELEKMIEPRTFLVCVMLANNETGVIQDLRCIREMTAARQVLLMSDCVQALGKIPVDVQSFGLDYAVFSAHKVHGPKGAGALYVREGALISALIHGGHQENGLRAGTESIHNIAGLAAACRHVPRMLAASEKITLLKNMLLAGLKDMLPGLKVNSPEKECLPNTLNLTFPGFDNAAFMGFLDYHGIAVSAGSACNTQINEPSPVLKAIGLTDVEARQTLRISLSAKTSAKDIRYVLKVMRDYLQKKLSPVAMISPGQLDENMLFNPDLYILDIRTWYDRKILKSLPNSHEGSLVFLKKYLAAIPKEKNIVLVCQAGLDSPVAAYYLRSKGFRKVGFLMGGLAAWRLFHPDLYAKFGGKNEITLDEPMFNHK